MHSRNEYLKVLGERYFEARTRKLKSQILDEYCHNTGQSRKYVIGKMRWVELRPRQKKKRKETYDGQVKAVLAKIWEIFDYPCGQRLKPLLETEVDRLMELGEIETSDEVALKLKALSPATIDRKLKHQREFLHLSRSKGGPKPGYLLKQKIPIKLTAWDTSIVGYLEVDSVVHCGSSTFGEYVNTLSSTEISEFINQLLYKYCQKEKLEFTRSRVNKKNDNAYIEQKNWTHVRKIFGYLKYDTYDELAIMNDLYHNELRLYKNFFQPVMKLKRKYEASKTPYQRLMESGQIRDEVRDELKDIYLSLNPAQLKRSVDAKLAKLYKAYAEKGKTQQVNSYKKLSPRTVRSYMIQRPPVGLPT